MLTDLATSLVIDACACWPDSELVRRVVNLHKSQGPEGVLRPEPKTEATKP